MKLTSLSLNPKVGQMSHMSKKPYESHEDPMLRLLNNDACQLILEIAPRLQTRPE